MKMLPTTTPALITQYPSYVYNCLRNAACEPPFAAPLPGVSSLQLYADLGAYPAVAFEIWIVDTCDGHTEQIVPANYVIGQTPEENWYGVFKYFAAPLAPVTSFVVWLSVLVETPTGLVEKTFFSQQLIEEPCQPLTKVASCYPQGATNTGFDSNDVYYGLPQGSYLGTEGVRYFHVAYVRRGKVRETSNKATFKSSLRRNFRTTLERLWRLETELVPQWYKDVLLAIYLRGAIQVDGGPTYLVSELSFETINEDDRQWKPFAQLKETRRLYFGCDTSVCSDCCSPRVNFAAVVGGIVPTTYYLIDNTGTPLVDSNGDHLVHQ